MGDLAARLMPLFRRSSTFNSTQSSASGSSTTSDAFGDGHTWSKSSLRPSKNRKPSLPISVVEENELLPHPPGALPSTPTEEPRLTRRNINETPDTSPETPWSPPLEKQNPLLTVEAPTPELGTRLGRTLEGGLPSPRDSGNSAGTDAGVTIGSQRPGIAHGRKSLKQNEQSEDISNRLGTQSPALQPTKTDYFGGSSVNADMVPKKIWVKKPGSSATQVTIKEDDLVDDVRDTILTKYINSLGRNFDPPDITLRMVYRKQSARHSNNERTLGPEEPLLKLLELHYPGGQSVEEALIIDVPKRQTPRLSPRMTMQYYDPEDFRPHENGTDYFPPMPLAAQHSPHLPTNLSVSSAQGGSHHPPAHSMAILTTGQLPNLPSAGGKARHSQNNRPRYGRQHTSSPTVIQAGSIALNHGKPRPPADPRIELELTRTRESESLPTANAHTANSRRDDTPQDRHAATPSRLSSSQNQQQQAHQKAGRPSPTTRKHHSPSHQRSYSGRQYYKPPSAGSLHETSKSALEHGHERQRCCHQVA